MITKELLKEAGWECVEVGDNGPATPKRYRNRYEVWSPISEQNHLRIIYDRTDDNWIYNGKIITELTQTPWACTSDGTHFKDLEEGDLIRHKDGIYATVIKATGDTVFISDGAIPVSWIRNWKFIRHED